MQLFFQNQCKEDDKDPKSLKMKRVQTVASKERSRKQEMLMLRKKGSNEEITKVCNSFYFLFVPCYFYVV